MLSGNGTIDYNVEAHTLDAHKTSAARQESTTRNLHGSAASTFHGSAAQNLQIWGIRFQEKETRVSHKNSRRASKQAYKLLHNHSGPIAHKYTKEIG